MLAIIAPLKARLDKLPQLTGWDKRANTEEVDRSKLPAVDIRCVGAAVSDSKRGAAMLAPRWMVTVVVRRGDAAAGQIDTALSAVICALIGWVPPSTGDRAWSPFTLESVTEPMLPDEGLVGYEITFATAASYKGGNL